MCRFQMGMMPVVDLMVVKATREACLRERKPWVLQGQLERGGCC